MEAYFRMESVEFTSRIIMTAMQIGNPQDLPQEKMGDLMNIRKKLGIN